MTRKTRANVDSEPRSQASRKRTAKPSASPSQGREGAETTAPLSWCLLFCLIFAGYLVTLSDGYVGVMSDGVVMFETAISLYAFGELKIPPANSAGSPGVTGPPETHGKYGLGYSLVEMLPLMLAAPVEKFLGSGRSSILVPGINALLAALSALLLALSLSELGLAFRAAALAAVGFAFGTIIWPYVSCDFSEPLQALGGILAFWLLLCAFRREPRPDPRFLLLAGFALGFTVLTKAFLILLLPAFFLYVWLRARAEERLRGLGWLLLPLVIWGGIVAALNIHRFGSMFDFGYGEESGRFSTPLWTGLYGLLISPNKGLLFYLPLSVLAPWGLWRARHTRRPECVFLASILLLILIPTAKWWSWEGGASWGPRLLVPIVPFLVLAAALLLEVPGRAWAAFSTCLVLGVAVNLIAVVLHFETWNRIISAYPGRVAVNAEGRPAGEYIERDGKRWFPPSVAANYVPELSGLWGSVRLLGLSFFNIPFSVSGLSDPSVSQPSGGAQPFQVDRSFIATKTPAFTQWLFQGPHFWYLDWWLDHPRQSHVAHSRYGLSMGHRGDYYLSQGRQDRALACYRKAQELMPDLVVPAVKLSQLQMQMGSVSEAEQTLVEFLARHPQEAPARLMLAHVYDTAGRPHEALDQYRAFLSFHPGHESTQYVTERIQQLQPAR